MAGGWTRDGGVQDQIDASVEDAVKLARSRLPDGEGSTHCEECENLIPDAPKQSLVFVYASAASQSAKNSRQLPMVSIGAAAKIVS